MVWNVINREILGWETQNTVNNITVLNFFSYLHSLHNYLTFQEFREPPQCVSPMLSEYNTDQAVCLGHGVLSCRLNAETEIK